MDSLWKLWLGVGVLATIVYVATVESRDARLATFVAVGLASAGLVFVGLAQRRPERPLPWVLVALGLFSFVAGDLTYRVLESTTDFPPFPSIADVFYLSTYPLLGFAIFSVGYRAGNPRHRAAVLGALSVGLIASSTMWRTFVGDTFGFGMTGAARVVALAYPAFVVVVLMAASYAILASNSRRPRVLLLAFAGVSMFVADALYHNALNNGTFAAGGAEDFFWLLSYVLVGAAALAPFAKQTREHSAPSIEEAQPGQPALV